MAESPPPGAAAQSCGEDPERGGERRSEEPEEPRGAAARGTDREDEAGPSEPDSPVAAPFFLLYPGDGGAGFAARPPPQRAWRTPPSPGSPLPFLLLSYPSGGSGGSGGKHRECWGRGRGGDRLSRAPPLAGLRSRAGWGWWGPRAGTGAVAVPLGGGVPSVGSTSRLAQASLPLGLHVLGPRRPLAPAGGSEHWRPSRRNRGAGVRVRLRRPRRFPAALAK